MIMRSLIWFGPVVALGLLFASANAHADEPAAPPPAPPEAAVETWNGTRFQLDVGGGWAQYHRTNRPLYVTDSTGPTPTYGVARGAEAGLELSGELHVHPHPFHGLFVGWGYGGGIFGPTVNVIHAGYSLRIGAQPTLRGVHLDGLFDIGPAIGFVQNASEQPDHVAIGGHVGAGAQLYFWNFYVGARASYDAGYSTAPGGGLDGAFVMKLDLGFAVDFRNE